jgi:hypothetical protein
MPNDDHDARVDAWIAARPSEPRAIRAWVERMPPMPERRERIVYKVTEQPAPVIAAAPPREELPELNPAVEALADAIGATTGRLERRIRELELQLGYERRLRELENKLSRLTADLDADHSRSAAPLIPLRGGGKNAA